MGKVRKYVKRFNWMSAEEPLFRKERNGYNRGSVERATVSGQAPFEELPTFRTPEHLDKTMKFKLQSF